jgi:hypothetical protein
MKNQSLLVIAQPWCSTGSVSDLNISEHATYLITGRLRSPYCTRAEQLPLLNQSFKNRVGQQEGI